MTSLKQILQPIHTGNEPIERFSFRVKDGVEIYEHEALRSLVAVGPAIRSAALVPKLVIAEAAVSGEQFIAKTRSEIEGLSSLLRTIIPAR